MNLETQAMPSAFKNGVQIKSCPPPQVELPVLHACSLTPPRPMPDDPKEASDDEESVGAADDARSSSRGDDAGSPSAADAPQAAAPNAETEPAEGSADAQRGAKRQRKAPIDIDEHIATARQKMKEAQKMVLAAKAQARNEKRKKQRLMKKASTLTSEDLERIAVWKRSGIDPIDGMLAASRATGSSRASSASGSATPASSPVLGPARNPEAATAAGSATLRP